jgi:hypothetical protein
VIGLTGDGEPVAVGAAALPDGSDGVVLGGAPVLTWLAVLGACAAAGLKSVELLLPKLGVHGHATLLQVQRAGDFSANLGAVSGLIALSAALVTFVRVGGPVSLRRRLLMAGFAGILLPTVALATALPKERTTLPVVVFGLGAAHVLSAIIATAAALAASRWLPRIVALAAGGNALFALLAHVLQLWQQRHHGVLYAAAYEVSRAFGEASYLALLVLSAVLLFPRTPLLRDRVGRWLAFAVWVVGTYSFYEAYSSFGSDYVVALYQALRVTLFLEREPIFYALPVVLALGAALAALIADDRARAQAALGVLLFLAAGYAPRAPGKFLALALGTALLSRALLDLARHPASSGCLAVGPGPVQRFNA